MLDAELRDHIERHTAAYVGQGLSEDDARRRARIDFGGVEQIKETCRDARGVNLLHDLGHDLRIATRTLRTQPAFAAVAVCTLALGIGATTAIFSLLNGLHFRRLPVASPASLVFVEPCTGSETVIRQLRTQTDIFSDVAGWTTTQFTLGTGRDAEWVDGLWVTDRYFETLGIPAQAGRLLAATPRGTGVMISDAFWQRRFARAPEAIGRGITIDRRPFRIVGVTPRGFTGVDVGRTFDIVAPLSAQAAPASGAAAGCGPLSVIARLAPGQEVDNAAARGSLPGRRLSLRPAGGGTSDIRPRYDRPLVVVMAVAVLVLSIACATLANLLMARAITRRREAAVKLSLGAPRWRLVRQSLIESAMIAAAGAAAGLVVAYYGSRLIVAELAGEGVLAVGRIVFGSAQPFLDVSIDARVLGFSAAVAAVTALLFGVAPAIRASSPSIGSTAYGDVGGTLVVAQVALSLMLLVAAGLFLRSLGSLLLVPLGFEPDRMLVVDMITPPSSGGAAPRMPTYQRVREAVRRLSGVAEATLSVSAPMTGWDLLVEVETGSPEPGAGGDSLANIVTPGWFRTLGTPLVAGRDFTGDDGRDALAVVIVNEAFARQFLRGGPALGRTIRIRGLGGEVISRAIVGVAADAVWSLRDPVPPIVYVPLPQASPRALEARLDEEGLTLAVRTDTRRPDSLRPAIGAAIYAIDPDVALTFRSPAEHLRASLTQERVVALVTGFFGLAAIGLAAAGLYGVASCRVSCRHAEIAIRLALGQRPESVAGLVLGRVWVLVAAGIAVGLLGSAWLTPLAATMLYGVEPNDSLTTALAVLAIVAVATLAGAIPAVRAARINAANVLRA
jgi:putative ABC transport system permease protein